MPTPKEKIEEIANRYETEIKPVVKEDLIEAYNLGVEDSLRCTEHGSHFVPEISRAREKIISLSILNNYKEMKKKPKKKIPSIFDIADVYREYYYKCPKCKK